MKSILALLLFIIIVFNAAFVANRFRPGAWYKGLQKPSWTPPNWLFPTVWTVLYILIAVSGWLVWRETSVKAALFPLIIYLGQLILNALWTWFFFGLHKPGLAFLDIVALWFFIVFTIILFWPFSKLAGILLLPYLLWITFAATLNYCVWKMNSSS